MSALYGFGKHSHPQTGSDFLGEHVRRARLDKGGFRAKFDFESAKTFVL